MERAHTFSVASRFGFASFTVLFYLANCSVDALAQRVLPSASCAPVDVIKCSDMTGGKSDGFRIQSACSQEMHFQYKAFHRSENKTFILSDSVAAGKTIKHCAITADGDHIFLHFVMPEPTLSFRQDPNRMKDIQAAIGAIADPAKPNAKASHAIVVRSLSLSNIPDTVDFDDFTTNAHRSWTDLNDLRSQFSQNIPLRNAEYYLMGYYAGLSHDAWLSVGVDFGDAYMALKWAARTNSFTEPWVRSNPDVPSSPPGGVDWAQRGLTDGRAIRDTWINAKDAKARPLNFPAE